MRLTAVERERVRNSAERYGLDGDPEQLASQAVTAVISRDATEAASAVAEAASIEFICDATIWLKREEESMLAEQAREILRVAKRNNSLDDPISEDDTEVIAQAEQVIRNAEEAWAANIRVDAIEQILTLARGISGNGASAAPSQPEPEPPAPLLLEHDAELAQIEPWEGYERDTAKEIIEGITIFIESTEDEKDINALLAHLWTYESSHRARKGILDQLQSIARKRIKEEGPQEQVPQPPAPEPPVPSEPDAEPEPEPEPQPEHTPAPESEPQPELEPEPVAEAPVEPQEATDSEYDGLFTEIEQQIKRERLHIPGPLPDGDRPQL